MRTIFAKLLQEHSWYDKFTCAPAKALQKLSPSRKTTFQYEIPTHQLLTWPWKGHVNICHLNWLLQIDCTTGIDVVLLNFQDVWLTAVKILKLCQNKKGQTFVWVLFLQQSTDKNFKKGFKKRASQQRFDTSYFVGALLQTCKTEFTLKNAWVIDTPNEYSKQ